MAPVLGTPTPAEYAEYARSTYTYRHTREFTRTVGNPYDAFDFAVEARRIAQDRLRAKQDTEDFSVSLSRLFSEPESAQREFRRAQSMFDYEIDGSEGNDDHMSPPTTPILRRSASSPVAPDHETIEGGYRPTSPPASWNFVRFKSWSVDGKRKPRDPDGNNTSSGSSCGSSEDEELRHRRILQRSLSAKLGSDLSLTMRTASETMKTAIEIRRIAAEAKARESVAAAEAKAQAVRSQQQQQQASSKLSSSAPHASIADIFAPLRAEEEAAAAAAAAAVTRTTRKGD